MYTKEAKLFTTSLFKYHKQIKCYMCQSSGSTPYSILRDYFGLSHNQSNNYIQKHNLYHRDPEDIINTVNFCTELGFTNKEIIRQPSLFRMPKLIIEQHYLLLQEGGFNRISAKVLAKYRTYYLKDVATLKNLKFIATETDVADHFLSYLKPCPSDLNISNLNDNCSWRLIHYTILSRYLEWRLEATSEEIEKLLRVHRDVSYKSLRFLCENFAIAEDLGFTARKLLRNGYILQGYPNYTKDVLENLGNIAGADMRLAMRQYPKLVTTSPKNILKIYGTLKEHGISDETIQKQMNVFTLSPDTVKLRLEEIKKIPDLRILLDNPRVLKLIIHHNRARSRLTFLQQLQLHCAGLVLLGGEDDSFEDHIREGKDINNLKDVLMFLKNLFQKESSEFESRWRKHPFNLQVPLVRMNETFMYLMNLKYKMKSIYRCFHILLYPKEKITKAFLTIRNSKEVNAHRLTQVQKLNLALYHMEKEHHFTGNGIWEKSDAVRLEDTK